MALFYKFFVLLNKIESKELMKIFFKFIFLIYIFSFTEISFGQIQLPDSVNKTINGMKEGYWISYSKANIVVCFLMGFYSTTGHRNDADYQNFCKSCVDRGGKIDSTSYSCITGEGNYSKNLRNGFWIFYTCDSEFNGFDYYNHTKKGEKIFQIYFNNDSINGILTTYYPTGQTKSEIEFKYNVPLGSIKCYFEDGKTYISGTMKQNEKFFLGDEYSPKGYKLQSRYFLLEDILKEWTDLAVIEKLIKTP
ncbi:MAG: hypothetical protein A2033_03795 [Bacteroidetes bacterium GWA2_31_9]|nr:MAG: hypothetical protein A2033_03795 [Bacteroidetes bacterium GWA2_31_9]